MSRNKDKQYTPDLAGIVDNLPLLMYCYSRVNSLDSIKKHFDNVEIYDMYDHVMVNYLFALTMLPKLMAQRGYKGLSGWGYIIKDVGPSGGKTYFSRELIVVSEWFLENPVTNPGDIYEVILHEIAHANRWLVAKDSSHSIEWQQEAHRIGSVGKACMPAKYKDTGTYFDTLVYKCTNETDKCTCAVLVRKHRTQRSKKMRMILLCDKHHKSYELFDVRGFNLSDFDLEVDFALSEGSKFGNTPRIRYISDGEVVELEDDGDIRKVNPTECRLYD